MQGSWCAVLNGPKSARFLLGILAVSDVRNHSEGDTS